VTATSFSGALTGNVTGNINSSGISTLGNTVVGGGTTQLIVTGDARITGILTIGTSSITLDGSNNQVNVGTGVTLHHTNGVQVGGNTLHSTVLTVNQINASGVVTATSFSGSGANLTGIGGTTDVRTNSLVVSGITTVAAGSTAAPSITPTGDSNTGIFFPSADTIAFAEGGVEALRIDSSGRVTMPYQPGFKIGVNSRNATGSVRILSTDAGDTFQTTRDYFNTGSHFTTSNGRFTAPVAGTYMFILSVMRNAANGSAAFDIRIQKNTSSGTSTNMFARIYAGSYTSDYQQSMLVTTTELSANDYVNVVIGANTSIYNDDTYFAGHLMN